MDDVKLLVSVLSQGTELIREIEGQLGLPCSAETCKLLAGEAQSIFARAIAIANALEQAATPTANSSDSPLSNSDSPRCLRSDKAFKELERSEMCKKRKNLPRWCSQVSACSGSSMEGPVDDGYSWRKYGQKEILGAKFPRGYYRCTYRHSNGCLATKQVQRSEENPSFFDVNYRGIHTCTRALHRNAAPQPKEQNAQQKQTPLPKTQQQQLLDCFRSGLTVKTEGFGSDDGLQGSSSSFSFASTAAGVVENHFSRNNYSPTFVSTTTSTESNYFPVCGMGNYVVGTNHHGFDSEIAEIISAAASATNSPTVGMDFGFDTAFPFDFP
ncbi:hypothetical protein HPP92_008477 [Vanilla planifolia]|uniref:WRKY domain-containing protein n=1 Tax=Vanilla planifolia TaxID=51239 RepID=A0A835V5Q3_VANPL|nr:hypothetical protein HPP92_008477 [Vanilla planifolia]